MRNNPEMDRYILPLIPFGNIYWYSHILSELDVWIDPNENFIKQSLRNRFVVLNHQGRFNLTIPIKGQNGIKTPLNEIEIINDDWKQLHLKTLNSCYNSSPYFMYYKDALEELYSKEYLLLQDFSIASFDFINKELNLGLILKISSEYLESGIDQRHLFKRVNTNFIHDQYQQVFIDRISFENNLSILDLLFNLGPESEMFLSKQSVHS